MSLLRQVSMKKNFLVFGVCILGSYALLLSLAAVLAPYLQSQSVTDISSLLYSALNTHCHQIPLDTVSVDFQVSEGSIEARCRVRAQARTGVEMEALVGVSAALNTLWDMVKYLEKDEQGQYPGTRITDIHVLKKEKGQA